MRVSFPILFVSDMDRAVAFYRDTIGLPLRFQSPGWSEFGAERATLALHASRGDGAGPDDLPPGRCRPGLGVPDLEEFHRRMVEAGVRCIEEPRSIFGAKVAVYADPDGLPFSVGEEREGG